MLNLGGNKGNNRRSESETFTDWHLSVYSSVRSSSPTDLFPITAPPLIIKVTNKSPFKESKKVFEGAIDDHNTDGHMDKSNLNRGSIDA